MSKTIIEEVVAELDGAEAKFAPFNSAHEGYAVLLEEVDELWDVVKLNPKKIKVTTSTGMNDHDIRNLQEREHLTMMRAEAIQVAAMALRFIKGLDSRWGR